MSDLDAVRVADTPTAEAEATDRLDGRWLSWTQLGLPAAALLTLAIGIASSPRFLTVSNFLNILNGAAVLGLIALPMTYVLIIRGLADLSVPAAMATGGIVALSFQSDVGTSLALLGGVAAATLAGVLNAVLIAYLSANAIIITLGVNTLVLGVAQAAVGGTIIYGQDAAATRLLRGTPAGVPFLVYVFAIAAVGAHLLLAHTVIGRWMFALGSNYGAAEAAAVPVRRTVAIAFTLTATMSGLAGALLAIQLGQVRPGIGIDYDFAAVTAVIVGGTSLLGGAGSIPRTVVGLLIVQTMANILSLIGVPTPAQGLAKGAIIVVAASIEIGMRKRRR